MKRSLKVLYCRFKLAEERSNELEDKSKQFIQSEQSGDGGECKEKQAKLQRYVGQQYMRLPGEEKQKEKTYIF